MATIHGKARPPVVTTRYRFEEFIPVSVEPELVVAPETCLMAAPGWTTKNTPGEGPGMKTAPTVEVAARAGTVNFAGLPDEYRRLPISPARPTTRGRHDRERPDPLPPPRQR
jgi:hypothetical protein